MRGGASQIASGAAQKEIPKTTQSIDHQLESAHASQDRFGTLRKNEWYSRCIHHRSLPAKPKIVQMKPKVERMKLNPRGS